MHEDITPLLMPDAGLESNYCRNPNGRSTVWCYTTDPETLWELCEDPMQENIMS